MNTFIQGVKRFVKHIQSFWKSQYYPNIDKTAHVSIKAKVLNADNLYMDEYTNINEGAYIMNTRAKFIMKKYSGAAVDLLAITGNHLSVPGKHHKQITDQIKEQLDVNKDLDKDIIVDEDVWIGARVTLLGGSHLGRCCIIGAGSVVRGTIPPYSIVYGNPAKIVGFRFPLKEILQHEEALFPVEERIPVEILQKNYEKYYLKRVKEIKEYNKI